MDELSPSRKFIRALLIGFLLSLSIFVVWLLVYDRQQQSETARQSIAAGWGGAQTISGPELAIPFKVVAAATNSAGQPIASAMVERTLTIAPDGVDIATRIAPEKRSRSIYDVVIYRAANQGRATFSIPADLSKLGVPPGALELERAEVRFGVSDPRGLGANPRVRVAGRTLRLGPGGGTSLVPTGFYAPIDLSQMRASRVSVDFDFSVRGNASIDLAPRAGETHWSVKSGWPNPSFAGGFLPESHRVTSDGFIADYRIGNLALGRSLVFIGDGVSSPSPRDSPRTAAVSSESTASIGLIEPVDLYAQVNRATKYGFLFIGFTFLAYLLFDTIGGVRVASVEYFLAGAALVLFFVLLLAFAEVIGFTPAYILSAAAIAGLNTAYSAAVLKSWRRAAFIGGLLAALYAVLYVLLSLEAFSLLIGSLLLFAALAGVMYLTRGIDWSGREGTA